MERGNTGSKRLEFGTWAAIVSVAAILAFPLQMAQAAKPKEQPGSASKKTAGTRTLEEFTEYVLARGTETYCAAILLKLLDFPGEMPCNEVYVSTENVTDGMNHVFSVVLLESTGTKALVSHKLIITTTEYKWPENSEGYKYKASLAGVLEKVVTISGKDDPEGKPVRGSAVTAEKDLNAPEIKERFKHELDFWLKGAYRKKRR